MKYLCIQTCQHREDGQIHFCEFGAVYEFDGEVVEGRFREVGEDAPDYVIDFVTATEAELKSTKWKFSEAKAAIKRAFNITLNTERGTKKSDVIKQVLDARFRSTDNVHVSATEGQ